MGTRYDDLRPKNSNARRVRESQIKQCKAPNTRSKRRTPDRHCPPPVPVNDVDNGNYPWFSTIATFDPKSCQEIENDLEDFDPFSERDQIGDLDIGIRSSSLDSYNYATNRSQSCQLCSFEDPFLPGVPQNRGSSLLTDTLTTAVDLEPANNQVSSKLDPFSCSENDHDCPLEIGLKQAEEPVDPLEESNSSLLKEPITFNLTETPNYGFDRAAIECVDEVSLLGSLQHQKQSTDSTCSNKYSAVVAQESTLSTLVSRLSKCSLGEKQFIIDVLKDYSKSTLSSITRSTISVVSNVSGQMTKASKSFALCQSSSGPLPREGPTRLELPGDFITTDVNTFKHHIACTVDDPHMFRTTFCKGCCTKSVIFERVRLSVPFAIMKFKRGEHPIKNWSTAGWRWFDRFGNTALHIAAALGCQYQQLLKIVSKGIEIHKVNSAKQTFMHLLDPRLLKAEEAQSLRDDLAHWKFDFQHKDVQGRTFLDIFKSRGFDPVYYTSLQYLEPSRGPQQEVIQINFLNDVMNGTKYPFAKRLIENGGGSWDMLWFMEPHSLQMYPETTVSLGSPGAPPGSRPFLSKLMSLSDGALFVFKTFEDPEGRNCLHVAADGADPIASQTTTSKVSRLRFVERLLTLGVKVNHHDKAGKTPLMAHIRSPYFHREVLNKLIQHDADVNLRNYEGEAPIHLAVKLGNVEATKALLAQSPNIHVRDRKARGVLAVGESAQRHATCHADGSLYARIAACMGLAIDAGAIAAPTLFDEWDV